MSAVYKLEVECAIYQAAKLRQDLADALRASDGLTIDCGELSEMDCSAMQIFMWLHKEGLRLGKEVRFCHVSESMQQFLFLMGFASLLPVVDLPAKEVSDES